jgi:hypothetical protein
MAVLALTDAVITIAGTAVQSKANSVTLNYEVDAIEVTSFDGSGARKFAGGLQNNSLEVALMQDFAVTIPAGSPTTSVEALIYPLVGTTTTVTVKATSASTSATNPLYTLSGTFLASHSPVAGGVGELVMTSLSFTGGTLVKTTT